MTATARISDEPFNYAAASVCGAIFLADPPADMGRYYPDEYYVLPTDGQLERLRCAPSATSWT